MTNAQELTKLETLRKELERRLTASLASQGGFDEMDAARMQGYEDTLESVLDFLEELVKA